MVRVRIDPAKRFDLIRSGILHIADGLSRPVLIAIEALDPSIKTLELKDLAAMVEEDFGRRPTSQEARGAVEALEAPDLYQVCRVSDGMVVKIHRT